MIVGACVVELHIEGSQSLKAKRGVIRSLVRRVRNAFNLAVSGIGGQGTWQSAARGRIQRRAASGARAVGRHRGGRRAARRTALESRRRGRGRIVSGRAERIA